MKKALIVTSIAAALALGSAHAEPINVGGVVWDPDALFDFSSTDTMVETIVNPVVGGTIQGYAKITNINGVSDQNTFCPGCEVTYEFYGYSITSINADGSFTWTGGNIDVYVDDSPDFDPLLASTAGDGDLWLSLTGTPHVDIGTGNIGTLHSDPTPAAAGIAGDGRGFLDVTGGLAAGNFDTDLFPLLADFAGNIVHADLLFTSSFQLIPDGQGGSQTFVSDDGVEYGLFGSNDLQGGTIPEPTTIALSSLALLGMGLIRRRRRS